MERAERIYDIYNVLDNADQVLDLKKVIEDAFLDYNSAVDWFNSPVPALGRKAPYEVIQEDYDTVYSVLAGLVHGVFF